MGNAMPTTDPSNLLSAASSVDLEGTTILVVDDNEQNLELMQAYLEGTPSRILTCTDGLQAVEMMEREPVDLVLLDIMMPRMSGYEVCQKIKSSPRTREVPVIMITALHEVGDVERAIEVGTDDFLSKPINKLELLTRVRSLLQVRLLKARVEELCRRAGPDDIDRRFTGEKLVEGRRTTQRETPDFDLE